MLSIILLALLLFSAISGIIAWLGRSTASVVSTYVDIKESVERDKRARAIAETKTATELWAADDRETEEGTTSEVPLPSGHVVRIPGTEVSHSEQEARGYLIAKHGDNIAAYDAWGKAWSKADELTGLYAEVFAWRKEQKANPDPVPLPPEKSLRELLDSCTVDGKPNWEAYWKTVAEQEYGPKRR